MIAILPVLGMPLLAGELVSQRWTEAGAAQRVEADLRALEAVDQLRAAVSVEGTAAALSILGQNLGVTSALSALGPALSVPTPTQSRMDTDRLLAAIPSVGVLSGRQSTLAGEVARVRRQVDLELIASDRDLTGLVAIIRGYTDFTGLVEEAEESIARELATGREGVTTGQLTSRMHDLEAVVSLVAAGQRRIGVYLVGLLLPPRLQADVAPQLSAENVEYHLRAEPLNTELTDELSRTWMRLTADLDYQRFELAVDAGQGLSTSPADPGSGKAISAAEFPQILPTVLAGTRTMAGLSGLLTQTVRGASSVARVDRAAAMQRAGVTVATTITLLVGTIAAVIVVGGGLRRRLGRLAAGAQRLSSGYLESVLVEGPRELATAGSAINDAVANLRLVERKAELLAAGQLDSPELECPAPGHLGAAVQASVTRIVDVVRDREQLQQELAHRASHDALTGLINRAELDRRLDAALGRARRNGGVVSVLFVDLDRFKACNDSLGHAAGDHVLRTVAQRLTGQVRAGDTVGRLGGDEFVVLVETPCDSGELHRIAERIACSVSDPIVYQGQLVSVGASVGVAACRDGLLTGDELMRQADAAVYRSKASGGGSIETDTTGAWR
ncbi:MAG TPA: GGDEF domain-containing protein [Kineosporiaceae bacterium]|nr:GGDEF domain-containing protein [Kineosporiaceae bacterium]